MTPLILKYVPKNELELFEEISKVVKILPDMDLGVDEKDKKIVMSCHILAWAVAEVFDGLKVIDGFYPPCMEHSWLFTPTFFIIDVYPVAALGPILVDGNSRTARSLYKEEIDKSICSKANADSFKKAVKSVAEELRRLRK